MSNLPTVAELNNLATHDYDQWRNLIITGGAGLPFGSSASYANHPLREYFDTHCNGKTGELIYRQLFEICAENKGLIKPEPFDSEMLMVKECVAQKMHLHLIEPSLNEKNRDSLDQYMIEAIKWATDALEGALLDVAEMVALGVPLYRLGETRGTDYRLQDHEQPSAFLIGKWKYYDQNKWTHCLPDWASGHGFLKSDLDQASILLRGDTDRLSSQQFAALRAAYRKHIGYSDQLKKEQLQTSLRSSSKLLTIVKEVQDRYYGANFSIGDQQTWTTQKDVVEWLKQAKGLSGREAEAVDLVTRPDIARGRG